MFTDRGTFAKLLQQNEARIYWTSGQAPAGAIVHEWREIDGGKLLLKETDMPHETLYWVHASLL